MESRSRFKKARLGFQSLPGAIKALIIAVVVLAIAFIGYKVFFAGEKEPVQQGRVVTVEKGNISPTLVVAGTVQSQNQSDMNFKQSGTLISIDVKAGEKVKAGDELARIDDTDIEASYRIAKANYNSSLAQRRQLKKGTPDEVATTKISVESAKATMDNAKSKLASAEATNAQDLADAKKAVDDAKADMDRKLIKRQEAKQEWEDLVTKYEHPIYHIPNYTPSQESEVNAAQSTADSAYDTYITAKNKYEAALSTLETAKLSSQTQLETAHLDATKAENSYNTTVIQLGAKVDGATADDKTIQYASLVQAEESYESAKRALEDATLVAPFDGTVLSVTGNVGDEVSAGSAGSGSSTGSSSTGSTASSAVVILADLDHLEVTATVDQADITTIAEGQAASITIDAIADKEFEGKVTGVDRNPVIDQNVVTYSISVSIDKPDKKIQLGMGATINIDLGKKKNVLIVPNLAVRSSNGGKVVSKLIDGESTDVRVETGLSDEDYTEIVSGLLEGDQIMVDVFSATSTSTQRQNSGFGSGRPAGAGMMMGPH